MTAPPAAAVESVDFSRKWWVLAAVASGMFLGTIDGSIVNIALPALERGLNAPFALVQWVVLSYLLTVATLMLAVGRLADMIGKKPLYLAGFVVFTIGSGLCGLAQTAPALIGFRVLQAVGAAAITALGTAIVTEAFPPAERGKALGISGAIVSIGLISGPTLGGLILQGLSWHWIFFVNLPVGIIGVWMVQRYVPSRRPAGGERFDFPGALALFLTLFCFLMSLTLGQEAGFLSAWPVRLMLAAGVALTLFILREQRTPQPIIDLSMFRSRPFSINLLTGFVTFVSSAGTVLLMPFYLQNVRQFNPGLTGLLLSVVPITMGLSAPLAGSLSDRFGSRRLTNLGLVLLLVGYLAVSTLQADTPPLGYVLRFIPVGLGMGLFQSPNNSAIMGSAPRHRLGVASSLLSLSRSVGQTVGVAVLGAMWAGLVRSGGWPGDATAAPAGVQVSALHGSTLAIVALVGAGLLLSLWGRRD